MDQIKQNWGTLLHIGLKFNDHIVQIKSLENHLCHFPKN